MILNSITKLQQFKQCDSGIKTILRSVVQNGEPRDKLTYVTTEKLRMYKGERTVSSISGIGKLESYMQKNERITISPKHKN